MKTTTFKPPELSEHEIQNSIINALAVRGWMCCRFNSGSVKAGSRFIRFYLIHGLNASAGIPDLMAWKNDGSGITSKCLMVEVKDKKGKLSPSQERFRDWANRYGFTVHVCRSWQEVAELVEGL